MKISQQTAYDWYAGLAVVAILLISFYLFYLAYTLNETVNINK